MDELATRTADLELLKESYGPRPWIPTRKETDAHIAHIASLSLGADISEINRKWWQGYLDIWEAHGKPKVYG